MSMYFVYSTGMLLSVAKIILWYRFLSWYWNFCIPYASNFQICVCVCVCVCARARVDTCPTGKGKNEQKGENI